MCDDAPRLRSSLRDALANMRRVRSAADLKRMVVNWSYRPRTRQNCCGRYGEPGC